MKPLSSLLLCALAASLFLSACSASPSASSQEQASSQTASVQQPEAPAPLAITQQAVVTELPDDAEAYGDFLLCASPDFVIPALQEGYVPQGMCLLPAEQKLVISYYSSTDGENSILCVVDAASGQLEKSVRLVNEDGSVYTGHAGGLAATEKNLWAATGGLCQRLPVSHLMAAEDGGSVQFVDHFVTGTRASFANAVDGVLWVGDFYYGGGGYDTDKSHHMTTPDGSKNRAWAVGFQLDPSTENELKAESFVNQSTTVTPDYVLSIPHKIQGMTRLSDGTIALSESYGRKNQSHLLLHRNVLAEPPHDSVMIGQAEVPLWYLDSNTLLRSITMPPMSEAVESAGDGVYLLFESGAASYLPNGVDPVDHLYLLSGLTD